MKMRGEGTDLATRQGRLLDALLGMRHDLSDLDIDARRRDALTTRIDVLGKAVEESQTLAEAALGTLNRVAVGVALVDAAGTVVWSNRYLDDIAAEDDGLTIAAGRLRVHNPVQATALGRLMGRVNERRSDAEGTAGAVLAIDRRRNERPYLVAAFSFPHGHPTAQRNQHVVAVFVADPERRMSLPAADLETLFGLTPAESQVAALLASGDRLDLAARKLGVTTGTARTHLKHIFDKTGTGRQGELARLLQSLHGKIR